MEGGGGDKKAKRVAVTCNHVDTKSNSIFVIFTVSKWLQMSQLIPTDPVIAADMLEVS